jgi:hypothetical protein
LLQVQATSYSAAYTQLPDTVLFNHVIFPGRRIQILILSLAGFNDFSYQYCPLLMMRPAENRIEYFVTIDFGWAIIFNFKLIENFQLNL